jgi:hypothetical protein
MDNYIINKKSKRPVKIGSKIHRKAIMTKIRQNTESTTILTDIDYQDSKKLKKSLPPISEDKFYCYEPVTRNIITKNKSVKSNELINFICSQLPNIIDKILNDIDEDDDRDKTKAKMISIFHSCLFD